MAFEDLNNNDYDDLIIVDLIYKMGSELG